MSKNKKILTVLLCAIFASLIIAGYFVTAASADVRIDEKAYYAVTHVDDGDTFVADVGGREVIVRMLGVNTPETVDPRKPVQCFGPEASAATKELLGGHKVRLALNPNREKTDRYGRFLLYAYRDDGLFLNEYLLKNGFAHEYTVGRPYDMQKEFKAIERDAKATKAGLWGKCQSNS